MFAYNEETNIESSIKSVLNSCDENLNSFHVLANGCSDRTVVLANKVKAELDFDKMTITNITLGDKCNAWNYYVHDLADESEVHFFVDADVQFSQDCFPLMASHLDQTLEQTVTIAGMPLSGRNLAFYESLVTDRACFFGNLYGLKRSFLDRVREEKFRLPVGLNWIDSFLTKAVNTDMKFFDYNLPKRTTYLQGVGYRFDSLRPWKKEDVVLYINRIARYELGKVQEKHLDNLNPQDWPESMHSINLAIQKNFELEVSSLSLIKKYLVKRRLNRLIKRGQLQVVPLSG